ncbi:MAG: tyrosine-type recombinase/integrase, partial [Candidatus Margulisiibacteriota bacterium]
MENILSESEEKALLQAMSASRDGAIVKLMLTTGISMSELCQLTIADVNMSKKLLRVTGKKSRSIPLPDDTCSAVSRWLSERPDADVSSMFVTTKGQTKALSDRSVDHILRVGGDAAGIPHPVTSQLLRNTFAARLFQVGASTKQVSHLLGVTDYKTLHKYQRTSELAPVVPLQKGVLIEKKDFLGMKMWFLVLPIVGLSIVVAYYLMSQKPYVSPPPATKVALHHPRSEVSE